MNLHIINNDDTSDITYDVKKQEANFIDPSFKDDRLLNTAIQEVEENGAADVLFLINNKPDGFFYSDKANGNHINF